MVLHFLGSMGAVNVALKSVGVTTVPLLIAAACSADMQIVFLLTTMNSPPARFRWLAFSSGSHSYSSSRWPRKNTGLSL